MTEMPLLIWKENSQKLTSLSKNKKFLSKLNPPKPLKDLSMKSIMTKRNPQDIKTGKSPKVDLIVLKRKNLNTKERKAFPRAEASHQKNQAFQKNHEDHEDPMKTDTIKGKMIGKQKIPTKRIAKNIERMIRKKILKTIEGKIVKIKEETITKNHLKINIKMIVKTNLNSIRKSEKSIIKKRERVIIKSIPECKRNVKTHIMKFLSDNPVNKTEDNPTKDSFHANNTNPRYNKE